MILRSHNVVELLAPHWIGALINIATTAASTERKAQIQREANAANMASATQRSVGDSMKGDKSGGATAIARNQTLGLGQNQTNPARLPQGDGSFAGESDKHPGFSFSDQASAPDQDELGGVAQGYGSARSRPSYSEAGKESEANDTNTDYSQYAGAAAGLVSSFMDRPEGAQASPIPQQQPFSFTPTAFNMMRRR